MLPRCSFSIGAVTALFLSPVFAQQIRPGIFVRHDVPSLNLATSGYDVYMLGETHGLEENAAFQLEYLKLLHAANGLRDVAIEEDAVYEPNARAFVEGSAALSPHLCLRAPILYAIRDYNAGLKPDQRIRVHLTDVDSPAFAIRQHLEQVKTRLHASSVAIPEEGRVKEDGPAALVKLKLLAKDAATRSALRTIEFSIQALEQGLQVDTGPTVGSPYLEPREQAVASNVEEIARTSPLLVIYGADHVSRTPRKDAGPSRNQPLNPVALRLQQAGLKVYCVITYPLGGGVNWRGQRGALMWSPRDAELTSGETMDKVIAVEPGAPYFAVDPKMQRKAVSSDDVSRMAPDLFVLFRESHAMKNYCEQR